MLKVLLIKSLLIGKIALIIALKSLFKEKKESSPPNIIKLEYRQPPDQPAYIVYPHGPATEQHYEHAPIVVDQHQPYAYHTEDGLSSYLKRNSKTNKLLEN